VIARTRRQLTRSKKKPRRRNGRSQERRGQGWLRLPTEWDTQSGVSSDSRVAVKERRGAFPTQGLPPRAFRDRRPPPSFRRGVRSNCLPLVTLQHSGKPQGPAANDAGPLFCVEPFRCLSATHATFTGSAAFLREPQHSQPADGPGGRPPGHSLFAADCERWDALVRCRGALPFLLIRWPVGPGLTRCQVRTALALEYVKFREPTDPREGANNVHRRATRLAHDRLVPRHYRPKQRPRRLNAQRPGPHRPTNEGPAAGTWVPKDGGDMKQSNHSANSAITRVPPKENPAVEGGSKQRRGTGLRKEPLPLVQGEKRSSANPNLALRRVKTGQSYLTAHSRFRRSRNSLRAAVSVLKDRRVPVFSIARATA
jgi:hypothetical protein